LQISWRALSKKPVVRKTMSILRKRIWEQLGNGKVPKEKGGEAIFQHVKIVGRGK